MTSSRAHFRNGDGDGRMVAVGLGEGAIVGVATGVGLTVGATVGLGLALTTRRNCIATNPFDASVNVSGQ